MVRDHPVMGGKSDVSLILVFNGEWTQVNFSDDTRGD